MVIVEFYDRKIPMHNVVSSLANRPERVIFIGGNSRRIQNELPHIQAFLAASGIQGIAFEIRVVPERDLNQIAEALDRVVQEYPDCFIDLTGGSDLCICAAGMIRERYRASGLQMHQYNIRTGAVYDCDGDGETPCAKIPSITVAQYIGLHGGCVRSANDAVLVRSHWNPNADYEDDIDALWEISRSDPAAWNSQLFLVNELRSLSSSEDPLEFSAKPAAIMARLGRRADDWNPELVLKPLYRKGFLTSWISTDTCFAFRYRDMAILECMEKAGTILELKTWLIATEAFDQDGNPLFNDAASGVWLDWDGIEGSAEHDTANELDVILMRGLYPVFISCKNGKVSDDELYKLETVARRFGGEYARMALIGADLEKRLGSSWPAFHRRAQDMGIRILPDAADWTDEQFTQKLKSILS